jgi:Rrf2 family protein
MKFSSTEEYGLRCMLQMVKKGPQGTMTIVEISQKESMTPAYVAKIMGGLRRGGLVQSIRGQSGGYKLGRPAQEINVNDVLLALGGKFFSKEEYCSTTGSHAACVHTMDCSIRSLWTGLEMAMTSYLKKCRLSDLVQTEPQMEAWLKPMMNPAPLTAVGEKEKR